MTNCSCRLALGDPTLPPEFHGRWCDVWLNREVSCDVWTRIKAAFPEISPTRIRLDVLEANLDSHILRKGAMMTYDDKHETFTLEEMKKVQKFLKEKKDVS